MKTKSLIANLVAFITLFTLSDAFGAKTVAVTVGPSSDSMSFSPDSVTIAPGDTVEWTWDTGPHSATSGTPTQTTSAFDSGIHTHGFTFSHTFAAAGTFPYFCMVHGAAMTAQIIVAAPTPTPTPTPTATPAPTPTPTATPLTPPVAKGFLRVDLQQVASGLTAPTDLSSAQDGSGRLFIAEQVGRIRILKNGQLVATPFLDLSSRLVTLMPNYDERGFLGFAFHPGFSNPASPGFHKLYTYTNEPVSGAADFTVPISAPGFDNQAVIAEWKVSAANPDVVDVTTRREIMRIDHPEFNHDAGQLAFKPGESYLYISEGDGGNANDVGNGHNPTTGNAQDTTNVLGKILRIDPLDPALTPGSTDAVSANGKYRVPASNPFVSHPPVTGSVREIYAYGLRNPFRFGFDQTMGDLICGDVGQNHIEEIDIIQSGKNYGWHHKEGTFLFDPATGDDSLDPSPNPAFTNPIAEYDHNNGIAVIGGYIYRGTAIPALTGKYVFGDLSTAFNTPNGRLFYLDNLTSGVVHEFHIGNDDRSLGMFLKAYGRDAVTGDLYVLADSHIGPTGTGGVVMKMIEAAPAPALLNLSTRLEVQPGNNALIGGFIVIGGAPKPVILRAIGPSITVNGQPVPGTLKDPTLELHDSTGKTIDFNDNWQTNPQKAQIVSHNLEPKDPRESALFDTLAPGAYTAVMKGAGGTSGIGLVELYDADQTASANPVNISTRGFVQTDNNVLIGGFIIGGSTAQKVLLRAIGPTLAHAGITNALQDPTLSLHNANGAVVASNDNWKTTQQAAIEATGVAPTDDRESAMLESLAPGAYTAIVRGVNNTTGVALVEAYQIVP